jgi:hypothetical protein
MSFNQDALLCSQAVKARYWPFSVTSNPTALCTRRARNAFLSPTAPSFSLTGSETTIGLLDPLVDAGQESFVDRQYSCLLVLQQAVDLPVRLVRRLHLADVDPSEPETVRRVRVRQDDHFIH